MDHLSELKLPSSYSYRLDHTEAANAVQVRIKEVSDQIGVKVVTSCYTVNSLSNLTLQ